MKSKCSIIVFLAIFFSGHAIATIKPKDTVRITCIGASITYGATIPDHEQLSFPGQLQTLLGKAYKVENYGVSGTTLLKYGDYPYVSTPQYQMALKSHPDIVFIDLGGNDAKLINRVKLNDYEQDYKELIQSFSNLPTHPRIIIMLPTISFVTDTTGIWDPTITKMITPKARNVAFETGLESLDMRQILVDKPEFFPDKIHPNAEGSGIIAKRMFEMIRQQRDTKFDVFSGIKVPFKIDSFYGYSCANFTLSGRECKVVKPKWSAVGHPFVWRARFWGHEPQADIALLERGFHIVYCDAAEMLGDAEAIALWNNFYSLLNKAGLAKKAAMEGMSRGGVYVYNWAAVNPDKVACVYVDNPLLDMKAWPGAKENAVLYKNERDQFMNGYHLKTDEDVQNFKGSPIDKVKEIVKGHYPSLILCADEDEAVSPQTNTLLFEKKVKELGGAILVVHKPGFKHHPHSLPNPKVIVDFIVKGCGISTD